MRIFLTFVMLCLLFLPLSSAQGRTAIEPGLPLYPTWTSDGALTGSQHGSAVDLQGDLNGDGYADLVIGAPKANSLEDDHTGAAYVYQGGLSLLADVPHWQVYGTKKGSDFGGAVAWAGDVDGDGLDELLIGASMFGDPANLLSNQGAVYLYSGSAYGLSTDPSWTTYGGQQEAKYGYALDAAGDVNGDGYGDIIIGAIGYDQDFTNAGAAYVYYGSDAGLALTPDWTMYGGRSTAGLGSAVAGVGDVNGDGYDDVAIGAPNWDTGLLIDAGAVMLFLGSSGGLSTTPIWTVEGSMYNARLGYDVAGAGDVNNDSYADIIVGAPYYGFGSSFEGAAYLFLGGETGPGLVADWSRSGGKELANFGYSLSAAGDLNQDGYEDVVIGAPQYTDDHSKEGRVFAFYGSEDGLRADPSWWADGEKADGTFGYAVSGGASLNPDTYLDLAVGAPSYRLEEVIVGRAFVFYGVPEAGIPSLYDFALYLPIIILAP